MADSRRGALFVLPPGTPILWLGWQQQFHLRDTGSVGLSRNSCCAAPNEPMMAPAMTFLWFPPVCPPSVQSTTPHSCKSSTRPLYSGFGLDRVGFRGSGRNGTDDTSSSSPGSSKVEEPRWCCRPQTWRPTNLPKGWDSARDSSLPGPIGGSTASLVTHSEEEVRRPPRSVACERWQCMTTLPSLPGIFPRGRHSEHDSRQSLRRATGTVHRISDHLLRPPA